MPNRIIKESICTSEEIDQLSPSAEILFYRLMVNADDYGLFDARPKLVASKCFPLKSIDINSVQQDLGRLQAANLILLYEVDGHPYGKLKSWEKHQQVRAKRAKFPLPKDGSEIICNQLLANVPGIQSNPIQSNSSELLRASEPISVFENSENPEPPSPFTVVAKIPLVDKTEFPVTDVMVSEWTQAFPAVDVPAALLRIRTWCNANPAKKKTTRGVCAFVVRWLGKEQDSGRSVGVIPSGSTGAFAGAI